MQDHIRWDHIVSSMNTYVELYRYITTTFVNFLYESFFKQTSFVLYQDQSNYYIISHTILSSKHLFGILPQSVSVYTTT